MGGLLLVEEGRIQGRIHYRCGGATPGRGRQDTL